MAISVDQFARHLVDSGLLAGDAVSALIDSLPADKKPQDGAELARELVRQQKLTAYQAQQIYAGKGKSLVLGNYVILDKLGQGGMGLVLKAEHRRMKRLVALKVLSPKVTKSPEALRRFQREVEAAARLMHPHVVTALDADEAGGTHFLVMEYVDGTDLSSRVKKEGPLPVEQALECILQAARGLEYAHQHGVVHRDIKPANLLLDRRGTIRILDMGLARLDSGHGRQDQLTGTGQIMGTVDYMAPEQAMDIKHADARADVYSLGVTLWYLLTGRPLFDGETTVEKLMAHQMKPLPSLRSACPDVSAELDAVFAKMAAKTPEARYQTMTEVIADLELCRSGTVAAPPALSTAQQEEARLEEFLREIVAPSRPHAVPPQQASRPAAVAVAARTTPVADPDATLAVTGPQVATDPRTEQSLPRGRMVTPAAKAVPRPPRAPWWQDWRKLAAAGTGGLLLVLLGVWVIVRDQGGKEVARVAVPEGGRVTVETAKANGQAQRGKSSDKTPESKAGQAPRLAVAPFDAKKAKEYQAIWAKYLGQPIETTNSIGMRFVLIPPGECDMGSTEAEVAKLLEQAKRTKQPEWYISRLPSEVPKHRVRITKPFYLGLCEVTQAQYEQLVGSNPSRLKGDLAAPVETVNWDEVSAFCRKLGERPQEQAGRAEYRLPTEAEWEYACRAGTTTTWSSGDDEGALNEHAWFSVDAGGKTHPVGQKSPNAWGLYDMHGNVSEWCQDWWAERYYATSPRDDPPGALGGSYRVNRGGNWWVGASLCRASCRYRDLPDFRRDFLGFRLVRMVSLMGSGAASPQKSGTASPQSAAGPTPKRPASATTPPATKPGPPRKLPAGSQAPAVAPFDGAKTKEEQAARAKDAGLGTQRAPESGDAPQREGSGAGRWNTWPCPQGNPWHTCALNRSSKGGLLPPAKTWENPNVRAGGMDGIVVDSLRAGGDLMCVVWSGSGGVCCVSAKDGKPQWVNSETMQPMGTAAYRNPSIVDVHPAEGKEIVLGTPDGIVVLGAGGKLIRRMPVKDGLSVGAIPATGGKAGIVFATSYQGQKNTYAFDAATGQQLWVYESKGTPYNYPSIVDFTGKGEFDLVYHAHRYEPSREGLIRLSSRGEERWHFMGGPTEEQKKQAPPELGWVPDFGYRPAMIADFLGNGRLQICYSTHCRTYLVDSQGAAIWSFPNVDGFGVYFNRDRDGAFQADGHGHGGNIDVCAAGDVTGDGCADYVYADEGEHRLKPGTQEVERSRKGALLRVTDGKTGKPVWSYGEDGKALSSLSDLVLVDFSGDGVLDVISLTEDGLRGLDVVNRKLEWHIPDLRGNALAACETADGVLLFVSVRESGLTAYLLRSKNISASLKSPAG